MNEKDRIAKAEKYIDERTENLLDDVKKGGFPEYEVKLIKSWIGDLQYIREMILDINDVNKE